MMLSEKVSLLVFIWIIIYPAKVQILDHDLNLIELH